MTKRITMSVPHNRRFQMDWTSMRQSMSLSRFFDRCINPIGTYSIVSGISISAVSTYVAADFLVAGGVLLILASRFSDWWEGS